MGIVGGGDGQHAHLLMPFYIDYSLHVLLILHSKIIIGVKVFVHEVAVLHETFRLQKSKYLRVVVCV